METFAVGLAYWVTALLVIVIIRDILKTLLEALRK